MPNEVSGISAPSGEALPPLSAWTTEMLRLTAFHESGPQDGSIDWWEAITGEPPESKNMKPREGGFEVAGSHAGGILTFKADLNRYDWLFTGEATLDKVAAGFPTAGSFPEALNSFLPLMLKWFAIASSITRLAFGAVVLQPAGSRIAGYNSLIPYLPGVELDPEHSSEFSYGINRHHKATGFGDMHINRISRWTVAQFQPLMLRLDLGKVPKAGAVAGESFHAIRLELDINTDVANQTPFEKAAAPKIYEYLTELGKEIVQKGDLK